MSPRMLSMGTLTAATAAIAPSNEVLSPSANPWLPAAPSLRGARAQYDLAHEWKDQSFATGALVGVASVALLVGGAMVLSSIRKAA